MVSSTIIGAGILGVGALLFFTGSASGKQTLRGGGASGVLDSAIVSPPTKKSQTDQPDIIINIEAEKIVSSFGNGQTKKESKVTDLGGGLSERPTILPAFDRGDVGTKIRTRDLIATAPLIIQKQILEKLPKFNFKPAFGTITFGRFS